MSVDGGEIPPHFSCDGLFCVQALIRGGAVTPADVTRVTSTGMHHATGEGRTVLRM